MGKILILSDFFEIRELISEEFSPEGHMVVSTGQPSLFQELLTVLDPDVVLLDLHLKKANAWGVNHLIRKKSPQLPVLPFTAYPNPDGNIRLVLAHPEGEENLSFHAFKQKMNTLLNPNLASEQRKSDRQPLYPESQNIPVGGDGSPPGRK
jgi:CheY-like chemotaxis protein